MEKIDVSIGLLSAKYEGKTAGTIANNARDPGGKSYGAWQLSLRAGTLGEYVQRTKFSALKKFSPGSSAFDLTWKSIANSKNSDLFLEDQFVFIKGHNYDHAKYYWSEYLALPLTHTIESVIFSMSVQHGGVNKILFMTKNILPRNPKEKDYIDALYSARSSYVRRHLNGPILTSVLNRYKWEKADAYKEAGINSGPVSLFNCILKTVLGYLQKKKES